MRRPNEDHQMNFKILKFYIFNTESLLRPKAAISKQIGRFEAFLSPQDVDIIGLSLQLILKNRQINPKNWTVKRTFKLKVKRNAKD